MLGLVAVSLLSFVALFSSHIPVVVSLLLACLRMPHCHALVSCPRYCVVVLYCCRTSFFHVVVMVPGVSKLGGTSLGWGVLTLVLYHCLGATLRWRRGTWFLLADNGGFHGCGSHFCACGCTYHSPMVSIWSPYGRVYKL